MFSMLKRIKYIWILLAAVLVVVGIPQSVQASAAVPMEKNGSLVIEYKSDDMPISGAEFQIYKVADMMQEGSLSVSKEYAEFSEELKNADDAALQELAEAVSIFSEEQQIAPFETAISSENGYVALPEQQPMTAGLYLITGDSVEIGNNMYTPKSFFVLLPSKGTDGEWVYDLRVQPKFDVKTKTSEVSVVKIWKDDGYESKRPAQVKVQLMRGDAVVETVVLNKENNWKYNWKDLEAAYDWNVKETNISTDYEMSVECKNFTYYITNTYVGETVTPDDKLPQTGVLWWPVPVLAFFGIIFFFVGWMMRQKKDA